MIECYFNAVGYTDKKRDSGVAHGSNGRNFSSKPNQSNSKKWNSEAQQKRRNYWHQKTRKQNLINGLILMGEASADTGFDGQRNQKRKRTSS